MIIVMDTYLLKNVYLMQVERHIEKTNKQYSKLRHQLAIAQIKKHTRR